MKKFLIPIFTIFLILLIDIFIVSRMEDTFLYKNSEGINFHQFKVKDLYGNIITNDIFNDKFTVICLWVKKDKESGKIFDELYNLQNKYDDVQVIGIIGDLREDANDEEFSKTRFIVENMPCVTQITVNDDLENILKRIRSAPTIFFVDKRGFIVGQPIVGNEPELVKKEVKRLFEKDSDYNKMQEKLHKKFMR